MKFLNKVITELLNLNPDLSGFTFILPGKRPVVFIKKILSEKQYSGLLPEFLTVEEVIRKIAGKQELKGISMWLFAYDVYRQQIGDEDFSQFLKWFPTILKDWDDMLKFSDDSTAVLQYMLDEERIKNWGEDLGDENAPRKRNLNFWRKMNIFLPALKQKLAEKNWATSGILHETAKQFIPEFVQNTNETFVFIGFNAFTPVEELLVKSLLQQNKAECFFQSDRYYIEDERQEAGKFLREHMKWKEFNSSRDLRWIEDDFRKEKEIDVYEVSGNVTQTFLLPEIFQNIPPEEFGDTAIVLLDENLLPAALDAMSVAEKLNITMGFPLKNLSFSNAVKQVFYLQKQLEKNKSSYYYNDVLAILEEMPKTATDEKIVADFIRFIEERNVAYISTKNLQHYLSDLSFFFLLEKQEAKQLIDRFIDFCTELKFRDLDDVLYENISYFERSFKIIRNQFTPYSFELKMETLEVLINQLVSSETIDFMGEPLEGLQVMGLLETRLLNFKNIILLSVNEGKLPLGNTQNTYLPYDVRKQFKMHTFLENDGIYAYHFYRLLQDAEHISLLCNALSSGVNVGEKSRFITQIEIESDHNLNHFIAENSSEPISQNPMEIEKTETVMLALENWKERVSASHLTSYNYNPIDFYLTKVLKTKEATEIEEELSARSYGNLVHFALQFIYEKFIGKELTERDLLHAIENLDEAMNAAIEELKHQKEFYEKGMNYIHKAIAERVVVQLLEYDLNLVRKGKTLEIVAIEGKFEGIDFVIDDETGDKVSFLGYIDRIDRLCGKLRIIDYKTAKIQNLNVKIEEQKREEYFFSSDKKQAMQLCIYHYSVNKMPEFMGEKVETAIWSFADVKAGPVPLSFEKGNLTDAMVSVRNIILEILNPEIPFTEKVHVSYNT